jgi:phytanoyl-CoA dioxygenase PhyH
MEIGDWKATQGLNETFRHARELGLEPNLLELEAFGFTVVPPYKAAPKAFFDRMRDAVFRLVETEDAASVDLNRQKQEDRPAYGRQFFHLLVKDAVFGESLMNPHTLTFGRYLMGTSCRFYSMVAFYKTGAVGTTHMHNDSTGMPGPLPHYGNVCNVSWVLTDYTIESGTFYMVPGSHRYCRHPTDLEQPKFMGGPAPDDLGVPVLAEKGSLIVFHGNTWHGSVPKTSDGPRVHVANAFCRNYVNPAETSDDLPEELFHRLGPDFARVMGRDAWQGYGSEGPKIQRMAKLRAAQQSQYA